MSNPTSSAPNALKENDTAEFLLHEFDRESGALSSNEESGDKRITFLWTLSAALFAGFGALLTNDNMQDDEHQKLALFFGLVATSVVLMFGGMTFKRVLRRNRQTDGHKRNLDRIRSYFLKKDPSIKEHLSYVPAVEERDIELRKFEISLFARGGYAETVALLNSVLAGFAAGILAFLAFGALYGPIVTQAGRLWPPAIVGALTAIAAWRFHACCANHFYTAGGKTAGG